MAETYRVKLWHSGPWVGAEGEDSHPLSDFGYTDKEWDALSEDVQERLLDEWAEGEFWNAGYEYGGEIERD